MDKWEYQEVEINVETFIEDINFQGLGGWEVLTVSDNYLKNQDCDFFDFDFDKAEVCRKVFMKRKIGD